jgi:hypothetical protein
MQIEIVTNNTFEPVTQDEITRHVSYLGDEIGEISDLIRMAKSAREMIESYKNVNICTRTIRVSFEKDYDFDFNRRTFQIPVHPVISISSVKSYDRYSTEVTLTLNTDYHIRGVNRKEIFIPDQERRILYGDQIEVVEWRVEAIVGYAYENIPGVYKDAILKLVAEWYNNKGNYVPDLSSDVLKMLMNINDSL